MAVINKGALISLDLLMPELKLPRRRVHCSKCNRYLCELVVVMSPAPIGDYAEISNVKCSHCSHKNRWKFGTYEKDDRTFEELVELNLREKMKS